MNLNPCFNGFRAYLMGLALVCFGQVSRAETDPMYYAVQVSATVQAAPAQINLTWPSDANATAYTIFRKSPADTAWGQGIALAASAVGFADVSVTPGTTYEYQISKTTSLGYQGYGYITAAIHAPLVDNRGKVILIVANTYAPDLAAELGRLQLDLAGDGWTVLRHDVSPNDSVAAVKALILGDYNADPGNVKSVFLFGHVPVPYSGNMNPDGHPDHQGAWPADAYYGDMDGVWTDTTVNNTSAARPQNQNIPGDGKFDQSDLPSVVELQVGRVDLSNMTCFANKTPSRGELDLLRQYLNKDHQFRNKAWSLSRRGLVCDNFGERNGEAFAVNGWRNYAPFFGAANITPTPYGTYFSTLAANDYLCSYGTGGGSFYTCNGIGSSDDFATTDIQTVFTMFVGSYFGDWDNESNFLRAPLGSSSYCLASSWSGRPHWFYHHMALGETIGYSTRLSQNNAQGGLYRAQNIGTHQAHIALMGDPTLRLHPVAPAANLTGAANGNTTVLNWTASPDNALIGYHVYRGTTVAGPFTRLTTVPISATTFSDNASSATFVYMVRAVKLETSGSGTYENASQGAFYGQGGAPSPAPAPTTPPTATSATFVTTDTTTQGNWQGVYGIDGYNVMEYSSRIPGYASVSASGNLHYVWNWTTPDVRGLAKPGQNDRLEACWYSFDNFSIDLNLTDHQTHRVALYCLDADGGNRVQTIEITDAATGAVLDSKTVSGFYGGVYYIWDLNGHVKATIKHGSLNAVVSGLFFGVGSMPPVSTPAAVTPSISPNGGSFSSSTPVSLSSSTPGAAIHYTLDGTAPTISSPLYAGNLSINSSCALQAKTFAAGFNDSTLATASFTVTTLPKALGAQATFTGADATTQGTWIGQYGKDGFNVLQYAASAPAYAQVSAIGKTDHIWVWSSSDTRALQKSDAADRIAACWYSSTVFSIDINLTDGQAHPVSVYCLDWDRQNRQERIEIVDPASGAVLDSRSVSTFAGGVYLTWNLTGHVQIRVTNQGQNAVISGLFFGGAPTSSTPPPAAPPVTPTPPPAPAPSSAIAKAVPASPDAATSGSWFGLYGREGSRIVGDSAALPSYATITAQGQSEYTWADSTSDPRATQKASGTDRLASCWYAAGSFTIDVNLVDGLAHRIGIYCLDWDRDGRVQTVDVVDTATGAVLNTQTVAAFQNGEYLFWDVKGHVTLRFTKINGFNAVVEGLFFDATSVQL